MSGGPCPANFSCVPNKSSDLIRVVGGKNVKILMSGALDKSDGWEN